MPMRAASDKTAQSTNKPKKESQPNRAWTLLPDFSPAGPFLLYLILSHIPSSIEEAAI